MDIEDKAYDLFDKVYEFMEAYNDNYVFYVIGYTMAEIDNIIEKAGKSGYEEEDIKELENKYKIIEEGISKIREEV